MVAFYDGTCDEEYSKEYKNKKCKALKNKRRINSLLNRHLTIFIVAVTMIAFLSFIENSDMIYFFLLFIVVSITMLTSYKFATKNLKRENTEILSEKLSSSDEKLFLKRSEMQRKEIVVSPVLAHLFIFENESELYDIAIKFLNKREK